MARAPEQRRNRAPLSELVSAAGEAAIAGDAVTVLLHGSDLAGGIAGDDGVELEQTVATLAATDHPGATALLVAIQSLTDDDLQRVRVRRALAERTIPPALTSLDSVTVGLPSAEIIDVSGDTSILVTSARLSNGQPLTALTYLDHHRATVVTDAFVVSHEHDEVIDMVRRQRTAPRYRVIRLHPADAGARLHAALGRAHRLVARHPTDSWPASRPLLRWLCRQLPDGGRDRIRQRWTEESRTDLVGAVSRSAGGRALGPQGRATLATLVALTAARGAGDPLAWSPVAVELLFTERLAHAARFGEVDPDSVTPALTALVRFAHLERGVPHELTLATLDAIDRCACEMDVLDFADPSTTATPLLGTLAHLDQNGVDITGASGGSLQIDPVDYDEVLRVFLGRTVGGHEVLMTLDDSPLPDEPFAWHTVPAELAPRFAEILDRTDRWADEHADVEFRTAVRRLLALVAAASPNTVATVAETDEVGVALRWIIASANDLLEGRDGSAPPIERFGPGAGSPAPLAETILVAIGADPHQHNGLDLSTPDLLVSTRRAAIVAARDLHLSSEQR